MSIQQAMNNMLFSAQVGAGLYAHSPAGKKQAEIRQLKADYEKTDKTYSDWGEPQEGEEHVSDIIVKQQTERAERLAALDPTKENIARASEMRSQYETQEVEDVFKSAEAKALESLSSRINSLTERLKSFEERKSIIRKKGGKK